MTRANALHALGRHHEIVADMGELQKTFQNDKQVEHCINRAQFELRKAARPDYYGLLGVPSIASTLEIKAAYKKRALECHPDKHSDGGDAARAAAEVSRAPQRPLHPARPAPKLTSPASPHTSG